MIAHARIQSSPDTELNLLGIASQAADKKSFDDRRSYFEMSLRRGNGAPAWARASANAHTAMITAKKA